MNLKKILIVLLFSCFFLYSTCYADELSDENTLDFALSIQTFNYSLSSIDINARHAVVLDRCSKSVLYGKSEYEKCKMASTTKILTAIVVLDNCSDLNTNVIVSKKAARYWRLKIRINK